MRQITQLPNQIRIVTQQFKDRDSAAIGIWFAVGGRYEEDRHKGVAHFLEHMAFKGSRKYSCDAIKQEIEGVGGSLNAFTGEEETCYHAKVPSRHLFKAFDVLSDIGVFPNISKKDLEKERTVILEEIKMYHDLPQYYVGELLEQLLWPNHPLGKSLTGSPETVMGMSAADLRGFHQRHYAPQNMVISACGKVDHDRLVAEVRRKLGALKAGETVMPAAASKEQSRPNQNLFHKTTEQMHLAMGFLSYEINHPDFYALGLLSIILGGNMSSRLFTEVREKRGLAYSVGAGMKALKDTGIFSVRAGVDNAKIVPALGLILKVLYKVGKRGVSAGEFRRAREFYIGQFLLGLEDTMDFMLWIGEAMINEEKSKTVSEVVKKINAVTMADIQRVAKTILAPARLNAAVIGPMTDAQQREISSLICI